jgi:hypothetical protein
VQYFYDKVDGKGWRGDQQPPYQITHDPVLGPDGAGGLYIYGHSTPQIGGSRTNDMGVLIDGDGNGKHRFHKPAGATRWSAFDLVRDGLIDDATTARWSQFFHYHPEEVDFTWWNHTVGTFDASGYYLEVGIDTLGGPVLAGTTVLQSQPILPPPEYSMDQQAAHPSIAGGAAKAFAVVATATGVAAKIGLYIDDTNQAKQVLVGLYADAAGQPGALLAQTTFNCGVTCRGQWHELTLGAAPAIAIYKRYWIALLPVPTGGPLAYRASTTGAPVVSSASAHLTALPATWKSAPASSKATLAGYVVGR